MWGVLGYCFHKQTVPDLEIWEAKMDFKKQLSDFMKEQAFRVLLVWLGFFKHKVVAIISVSGSLPVADQKAS